MIDINKITSLTNLTGLIGLTGLTGLTRQKQIIAAAVVALTVVIIVITGFSMLQSASSKLGSAEVLYDYLKTEQIALSSLKGKADLYELKRKKSKGQGVHEAVNQTVSSLGLTKKLTSLKSPKGAASAQEERAEAKFEGITLNELVNLLFTLDNSKMLILTRKANVRVSFENPELLNATLSLTLIKPE